MQALSFYILICFLCFNRQGLSPKIHTKSQSIKFKTILQSTCKAHPFKVYPFKVHIHILFSPTVMSDMTHINILTFASSTFKVRKEQRLLTAQLSLLSVLWGKMKAKLSKSSHWEGVWNVFLQLVSMMKKWVGIRISWLRMSLLFLENMAIFTLRKK